MSEADTLEMLIKTVFPEVLNDPQVLEHTYPNRKLPLGAMVTRIAPSPTGFMHMGTVYMGLLSNQFANQTSGVSILRIEDTDKKREVEGSADFIAEAFQYYQIVFDEGETSSNAEKGDYGPYTQSRRLALYHTYIRFLLERGLAYLCFCTPDDLDSIRHKQESEGVNPGYYGKWAIWRERPIQDAYEELRNGKPYVVRLKSKGVAENNILVDDLIVGQRTLPENDRDIVLMKSDRLPTYHLAHVVDDHLMKTTHVLRGDEWLSSLPIHLQMFDMFGWIPPAYAHIAPINKIDGNSRRKLSKRKDPEASVSFFKDLGYPPEAFIEYLLNLANSDFEEWRKEYQTDSYRHFKLSFEKLKKSNGPLFDVVKLDSISRDVIARFSATEVYEKLSAWAELNDREFFAAMSAAPGYSQSILGIDRDGSNARKDIAKWSDVKSQIEYFFDANFQLSLSDALLVLENISVDEIKNVVIAFKETYHFEDSPDEWFNKIKRIASTSGYAVKARDLKKDPGAYKGTMSELVKVYRVLLTGKTQTQDLYSIMKVMGQERVFSRLSLVGV